MENKELISVIIPMYKVEKYLEKCIQSVVDQTYDNLEIILVDDGSPDRCPEICDEWERMDNRIKVIHKKNGGISDARNAGLKVATGKYVGFVDSDDYIEKNMYEKLYDLIKNENVDFSMCNFEMVTEDGKIIEKTSSVMDEVFSGIEGLYKLEEPTGWCYVTLWNKLCKREIFQNLDFPLGRVYEDESIAHEVIYKARKIASTSQKLYNYVQRSDSITRGTTGVKKLDVIEPLCRRVIFYKRHGLEELSITLCKSLKSVYGERRKDIFGSYSKEDKKRIKEIDKLFRKTYFSCANRVTFTDKIKYLCPSLWIICLLVKRKFKQYAMGKGIV